MQAQANFAFNSTPAAGSVLSAPSDALAPTPGATAAASGSAGVGSLASAATLRTLSQAASLAFAPLGSDPRTAPRYQLLLPQLLAALRLTLATGNVVPLPPAAASHEDSRARSSAAAGAADRAQAAAAGVAASVPASAPAPAATHGADAALDGGPGKSGGAVFMPGDMWQQGGAVLAGVPAKREAWALLAAGLRQFSTAMSLSLAPTATQAPSSTAPSAAAATAPTSSVVTSTAASSAGASTPRRINSLTVAAGADALAHAAAESDFQRRAEGQLLYLVGVLKRCAINLQPYMDAVSLRHGSKAAAHAAMQPPPRAAAQAGAAASRAQGAGAGGGPTSPEGGSASSQWGGSSVGSPPSSEDSAGYGRLHASDGTWGDDEEDDPTGKGPAQGSRQPVDAAANSAASAAGGMSNALASGKSFFGKALKGLKTKASAVAKQAAESASIALRLNISVAPDTPVVLSSMELVSYASLLSEVCDGLCSLERMVRSALYGSALRAALEPAMAALHAEPDPARRQELRKALPTADPLLLQSLLLSSPQLCMLLSQAVNLTWFCVGAHMLEDAVALADRSVARKMDALANAFTA
jgi:hypothetical protein